MPDRRESPAFPEWGMIPVPTKLLQQGVSEMVRISDSRMSGTSYGTMVIHMSLRRDDLTFTSARAVLADGEEIN
jgi:hypothetical protein